MPRLSMRKVKHKHFDLSKVKGVDKVKIGRRLALTKSNLTLETSAFEVLYSGQFTLSTRLINPNYSLLTSPPTALTPQFL